MKVSELLCILQDAMKPLAGNDVRKRYAAELIQETASQLPQIAPPLSVKNAKLWYDTPLFGEIPIIEFKPSYGKDNRTIDVLSYQIKQVEIVLIKNLPMDSDLSGLKRLLQYEAALAQKQASLENIARLEAQITAEKKVIQDMLAIIEQESDH